MELGYEARGPSRFEVRTYPHDPSPEDFGDAAAIAHDDAISRDRRARRCLQPRVGRVANPEHGKEKPDPRLEDAGSFEPVGATSTTTMKPLQNAMLSTRCTHRLRGPPNIQSSRCSSRRCFGDIRRCHRPCRSALMLISPTCGPAQTDFMPLKTASHDHAPCSHLSALPRGTEPG